MDVPESATGETAVWVASNPVAETPNPAEGFVSSRVVRFATDKARAASASGI